MSATSTALLCRNCDSKVASGSEFCDRCGTRVEQLCLHCATALEVDARFCCRCGAKCFRTSEEHTPTEFLLAASGLALQQASPQWIADACQCCLRTNLAAGQAAVAAVLATNAYARLGRFAEARENVIKARQLYATHLELTAEQTDRFIKGPYFIDDLNTVGERDLKANPWLWPILGHGESPLLPDSYNGETEGVRQAQALEAWSNFVQNRREGFIGIMGYLSHATSHYLLAARHLEKLLLLARRYEHFEPCRPELLWPRVLLGDCYREIGEVERAKRTWQRAASFRICFAAEHNAFAQCVLPWIQNAESRLLTEGCTQPAPEVTKRASEHLSQAMSCLLAAEQFEAKGEHLTDRVRRAGTRYVELVQAALLEVREAEKLDAFAWAKAPTPNKLWIRHEFVKALAMQKSAIWQMSNERLALSIASLKEANDLWPTLSFFAVMGGLQSACGLTVDARQTYQTCIARADELGAAEPSEDNEQTLKEVHEALISLPN